MSATDDVTKVVFTDEHIQELVDTWNLIYQYPEKRQHVFESIQAVTEKILSGEIVVGA